MTQESNCEYGQGIIYDEKTDSYGLTEIVTGQHDTVNFSDMLITQTNLVALVHSHPYCNGHESNYFSYSVDNGDGTVRGDWVVASSNSLDLYLAAPNGCLYVMY